MNPSRPCAALLAYRLRVGLSQERLAMRLYMAGHPCTQGLVSQWELGTTVIPAERCVQIEQVTHGAVTRKELRPDLFGELTHSNDTQQLGEAA